MIPVRENSDSTNEKNMAPEVTCTEKSWQLGGMQPVSIMGKHLNNFERLSILEDYLSGSDSKVAIEQKYGLSHGLIRSWLSKFGLEDKVHPVPMKVSQSPQSELPLNEKEELEQLRKENRVLKH